MARSVAQGKGGIIDVCGVAPARFQSLRDAGCGVNALSRLHKMELARRADKTRKRRIRRSASGNRFRCLTLLVVFFPRHRAFDRFFPACVTVITLSGFDAWTELAL